MQLLALSNELLLLIAEDHLDDVKDVYSFLKVNRHFYCLFTRHLYRLAAQKETYAVSALFSAAASGNEALVRVILERGTTMLVKASPRKILHRVPGKVDDTVVKQVLDKGTNLLIRKRPGKRRSWEGPALSWAVKLTHEKMVRSFLERGANVNATDHTRNTALHQAATAGLTVLVKLLLDHGAKVTAKGRSGDTPVNKAIQSKNIDVLKLLVENMDDLSFRHNGQKMLIHLASTYLGDDDTTFKWLLKRGANIQDRDPLGRTALHYAAQMGNKKIVKLLLDEGAVVDNTADCSAVGLAYQKGHLEVARLILERIPANSTISIDCSNWTLLGLATTYHDEGFVKLLLEQGADVNSTNHSSQMTALHLSANFGKGGLVRLLLEYGADINKTTTRSQTALHLASQPPTCQHWNRFPSCRETETVAKLLLDAGIDINVADFRKDTALHIAVQYHDQKVVKLLLERDADITLKDESGCTAMDKAISFGNMAVISLFIRNVMPPQDISHSSETVVAEAGENDQESGRPKAMSVV